MNEIQQEALREERIIEAAAQLAHEANRIYSRFTGGTDGGSWDAVTEEIRESARDGARRSLSGASAEMLHQSWMQFKAAQGWSYGPVKDPVAKTHPCMVDYAMLPKTQRLRDTLFQRATRLMAQMVWKSGIS